MGLGSHLKIEEFLIEFLTSGCMIGLGSHLDGVGLGMRDMSSLQEEIARLKHNDLSEH